MSVYGQQFGFAAESVWGTVVTPDHFLPLLGNESMEYNDTRASGGALLAGAFGPPASRSKRIRYGATGSIPLELAYSKLGLLLKQAMGSSGAATLVSGSVYKQVHQIGTTDGKSLTLQLGRDEVSTGTVKPFTYPGAKITGLTIAVSDGDTDSAQFTVNVDAKDEQTSTGLASAAYATGAAAGAFAFPDVSAVNLGGTASTSAGVISVSGGSAATTVLNSLSLSIAVPGKIDRYGLGNAGAKREQVNNAMPSVTGTLAGEFTLQSELYDVWKSDTTIPLQITFTGPVISGGNHFLFDIILPAVKLISAPPHMNGYDIPVQQIAFQAFRDDVNSNNMCQITYQNTDSTL